MILKKYLFLSGMSYMSGSFCVLKNTFFIYFALANISEATLGSVLKHSKLTFLYNQVLIHVQQ